MKPALECLATGNASKLAEFERLLGHTVRGIPLTIPELQPNSQQLELMRTPEGYALVSAQIAAEKAHAAYLLHGQVPVFIEDSALYLDTLEGRPGPLISSFSSPVLMRRLCQLAHSSLDGSPPCTKASAFVTLAVWNRSSDKAETYQGFTVGSIAAEPRGSQGFGWDQIFMPGEGDGRTFAEMTASEKDQYSMRRRALHELSRAGM